MKKSKYILLTIIALQAACQYRSGRADGSYAAINLGMREKGVLQTPGAYIADETSGVESFQNLTSFAKTLAYMDALKSVTGSVAGAWKSTKNATTAAGVKNAETAAGVEKAKIEADVIKSTTIPTTP